MPISVFSMHNQILFVIVLAEQRLVGDVQKLVKETPTITPSNFGDLKV